MKQLPPVSKHLRDRARELRSQMTHAEVKLWNQLKAQQLGYRFFRQKVVGMYICDFVSTDVSIVIEIDGSQHFQGSGKENDLVRDQVLKMLGFEVLRFSNIEVLNNLDGVMARIKENLR